jgi:N-acetyl-1-D-myo-inositol-2-amino-2-deoxy-alpha-D-glucopyranoside deacetylase
VSGGLLVVTAHPDDEVLVAGGALAACAAAGIPTSVVCLTRGEQGPISDPMLADRVSLPQVRHRELEAACAELGVGWVKCYRRADGDLLWSDGAGGIVSQLIRIMSARRPDAVITFGEDGLYYHPDHIAASRFVRRALRRCPAPVPALYRSVWPEELMPELAAELVARGLPADLWELEPEDFGTDERDGEVELDVREFVCQKLRALRCHRTQLGPDHAFAALPLDLAERFLGCERFVRVPAGDSRARVWLVEVLGASAVARA